MLKNIIDWVMVVALIATSSLGGGVVASIVLIKNLGGNPNSVYLNYGEAAPIIMASISITFIISSAYMWWKKLWR